MERQALIKKKKQIHPNLNIPPLKRHYVQQQHLLHSHQKQEITKSKMDHNKPTSESNYLYNRNIQEQFF